MRLDKNSIRFILSAFGLVFGAGYLCFASFGYVPEANHRTVDTVIGFICATLMGSIFGYYFGSSQGSADKTDILDKKPKEPGTPTNENDK